MVELIVVIAVVSMLLALLMPGLQRAKGAALRLMCAANERELGVGFMLYSDDNGARLPESHFQKTRQFAEMSAVATPETDPEDPERFAGGFDGIGLLWYFRYIDSPNCLHCPANSHRHTCEANRAVYGGRGVTAETAYSNYHYTGHLKLGPILDPERDRDSQIRRRMIDKRFVLSSDSLRSREDFSHDKGVNLLFSDGSVEWFKPSPDVIRSMPLEAAILNGPRMDETNWITDAWTQFNVDG